MKKTVMTILIFLAAAIMIVCLISAYICSRDVKLTKYEVPADGLTGDVRLIVLADLHGNEYGEDNSVLISMAEAAKPDAILLDGDMISRNADEEDVERFLAFAEKLTAIAPVFYSTGNHEIDYMKENGEALLERIAGAGVTVLYDDYVETELAGQTLRIGGTSGHYRDINREEQFDYAMQEEIGGAGVPAVVMMHMPENMVCDSARANWNADLYISGHTHGGLLRLPGIGGVYAPTQGFFPEYDCGRYTVDGRLELIITSGLAGYGIIPRVFNRPEIVLITLVPEEQG